jgi:Protein of unknown function (DUF3489)
MPRVRPPKALTAKTVPAKTAPAPSTPPSPSTKQDQLLALLNRPQGASLADLMAVSAWQQHSVRGFLAGTVKKKLGLALVSSKPEGEARCYRIAPRRGR